MRISELTAHHAYIPLKRRIRHASQTRTANDSLLVCCRLENGVTGWGEGLPREYVTGETIDSAWSHFQSINLQSTLSGRIDGLPDLVERLNRLTSIPLATRQRDCFGNSLRCAIELAVLDAACQSLNVPLSAVFEHLPNIEPLLKPIERVQYSAALTSNDPARTLTAAGLYRYYQFAFCKVKVGKWPRFDSLNLRAIRAVCGKDMDLRIDANEAWSPQNLLRQIDRLRPARISAIEQPLNHKDVSHLRRLRPQIGIPLVLDESLCGPDDARRVIDDQLGDIFNLRLSKCGGVIRTAALFVMARQAGLECQLGCQVGETGLLSAAGRHLACSLGPLRFIEGSFDRLLVGEPLIQEDITFKTGGWGAALTAPGLGVTMDLAAIQRVTQRKQSRSID